MKRSTLLTTVAALALSTAVAAAQSTPPTERRQSDERTAPSTTNRTGSDSSSPSAQPQNSQQQPSQGTSGSSAQQSQPSATQQRSTQGQQTQQPSTSQTQNQPAQSNQQQTQSPAGNNQRSTQGTQQQPSTNQAAQPSGQQQQSGQAAATTPQQRTQITAAIQQQNVSPVRVNFAVNVGVAVPASVRLAPLPATIVSIVPRYRGYNYFVTEERIVIVEPSSHKIVEVLPMEGRAAAAPARKERFTSEQRQSIKKHATSSKRPATTTGSARRVTVEESIPADVELEEFSDVVVREVPDVRTYRYIRRDSDVIVVDPGSRRVIDVID